MGIKKEDALALIGEAKKLTVRVEKGSVTLHTTQGVVHVPYEILKADGATKTICLPASLTTLTILMKNKATLLSAIEVAIAAVGRLNGEKMSAG